MSFLVYDAGKLSPNDGPARRCLVFGMQSLSFLIPKSKKARPMRLWLTKKLLQAGAKSVVIAENFRQ